MSTTDPNPIRQRERPPWLIDRDLDAVAAHLDPWILAAEPDHDPLDHGAPVARYARVGRRRPDGAGCIGGAVRARLPGRARTGGDRRPARRGDRRRPHRPPDRAYGRPATPSAPPSPNPSAPSGRPAEEVSHDRDATPSSPGSEIAALTARLRQLGSPDATNAERAAFPADKALLARIADHTRPAGRDHAEAVEVAAEAVLARAAAGGYAMVGPSARTWSVDTATGIPVGPVAEAEHRLVRDLIAQERLDGAEPVWLRCADGRQEIVALVVPATADADEHHRDERTEEAAAEDRDADGWFSGGYDAAHQAHPTNRPRPADDAVLTRTPSGVVGAAAMPAQMLEGIETRRTGPPDRDDPAELQARLDDLSCPDRRRGGRAGRWLAHRQRRARRRQLAGRGTTWTPPGHGRRLPARDLRAGRCPGPRVGARPGRHRRHRRRTPTFPTAARAVAVDAATRTPTTARAAQLGRWHTDDQAGGSSRRRAEAD